MSKEDAIARLRGHLGELPELLGGDLDQLTELLTELADRQNVVDAWLELVTLVLGRVPARHPIHEQFVSAAHRGVATLDQQQDSAEWARVAEEARAILAQLDPVPADPDPTPEEILAAVRDRLLKVPARTPQELRSRGVDPAAAGLIRLSAPDGSTRLPAFQFTAAGPPFPVVLEINRLLDAERDRWAVADWWLSENVRLGTAPAELVGQSADERLIAAARALRGRI